MCAEEWYKHSPFSTFLHRSVTFSDVSLHSPPLLPVSMCEQNIDESACLLQPQEGEVVHQYGEEGKAVEKQKGRKKNRSGEYTNKNCK